MSEILIATNLQKTWTAARSSGPARAASLRLESTLRSATKPAPAVDDVSLSVEIGEIFGLVGPSGSGKSTLLSLLSGQIRADAGHIEMRGEALEAERQRLANKVHLVSQMTSNQVFNQLGAVENLVYSARLHGINGAGLDAAALEQQAKTLLLDLGVSEQAFSQPLREAHFSVLQKVALGRALICRPSILLLDDITDGLDLDDRRAVLNVLSAFRRLYGTTIILATRSLRTAGQICDRIALLSQGKITQLIVADDLSYPVNFTLQQASIHDSQPSAELAVA